jgi:nicotinate-nucleotide adenylyltransferase
VENDQPIGILGGTFNPIHHGHLRLALELYERLNLAEVRLIPSAYPPHREQPAVNSQCRLKMVQAAVEGIKTLNVDDRELRRTGFSYTVDTLKSLREDYPHRSLCLILGMDSFLNLPQWHQWEQLIKLAHLLVVRRQNVELPEQSKNMMWDFWKSHRIFDRKNLEQQKAGHIWLEEIPTLEISATQIRDIIASGKNPHYLLPLSVLEIITKNQLYR